MRRIVKRLNWPPSSMNEGNLPPAFLRHHARAELNNNLETSCVLEPKKTHTESKSKNWRTGTLYVRWRSGGSVRCNRSTLVMWLHAVALHIFQNTSHTCKFLSKTIARSKSTATLYPSPISLPLDWQKIERCSYIAKPAYVDPAPWYSHIFSRIVAIWSRLRSRPCANPRPDFMNALEKFCQIS